MSDDDNVSVTSSNTDEDFNRIRVLSPVAVYQVWEETPSDDHASCENPYTSPPREQRDEHNKKQSNEHCVMMELVRLIKLDASMRICGAFDGEDLECVDKAIRELLGNLPTTSRRSVMKSAKAEHRKQLLGQLINAVLLDPEKDKELFDNLIRKIVNEE